MQMGLRVIPNACVLPCSRDNAPLVSSPLYLQEPQMNFKTTAAAVAMLAAMGAQAQVTVYGKMDLAIGKFQRTGTKSTTAVESNGSHIGFAVSEDLGSLKAGVQLESTVGADTGAAYAGQFWDRQANLSVGGEFGRVSLGRKETPFFNAMVAYNPFGDSGFSPAMNLFVSNLAILREVQTQLGLTDQQTAAVGAAWFSTRFNNSITYATPDLNGLSASVQIGLKESDTNGANVAMAANYAAGPFAAGLAYQQLKTGFGAGNSDSRWVLGGSYDAGVAKVYGQVGSDSLETSTNGTLDTTFFQVGAAAPVTAEGTAMVSFGQAKASDAGVKESILAVGYDQALSKRTGVYGVFTNDKATGEKVGTTLAVGVRHRF
jgi:predicted porin